MKANIVICASLLLAVFNLIQGVDLSPSAASASLDCSSFPICHHARGTAYYPDNSTLEGGYVDMRGAPLRTLQDFLEGSASNVSVAMDNNTGIAYGTRICIPELNRKYNRAIVFAVVDTGGAFSGKGFSRIDICVRNYSYSLDSTINGALTLCFPKSGGYASHVLARFFKKKVTNDSLPWTVA